MKITMTMRLVLIGAVLLAGSTTALRAQSTAAPALTEDDRSGDETTSDGPAASSEQPTTQPTGPKKTPGFFDNPLFLLIGAMLLMFIFMGRGKRKKEARRKEMLAALKKGDKVTTIGGIIGTVMEVRDDEVLVKIDESNNARMRFARWAIRGIGDQAKGEGPEAKK